MRNEIDYIRIKRKPFFFVLFILILALATPVLADYLGPNRTVTETISVCKVVLYECQYVPARDLWKYKPVDDWSCSNEGKPWQGYDNYNGECGLFSKGRTQWGKQEKLQTVTTTHPEATIVSALQGCNLNNGWCNTSSELSLTGTEPLSGYSILTIEGSLNGLSFACSGGNCTIPLNEGSNDFSFWAISSWGDSSQMGTFSAQVDTILPTLGLDIIATSGSNGWYVSPTTITASGSDSTSGLSSVFLSVDSAAWVSSTTLNEGVYNVLVQAEDNAGNIAQSSTAISVDTTTPTIDVSVNGTIGSNGWYSSSMQVSATASDVTSGVDILEAITDGGPWTAVNGPVSFVDGYHTVQFKAVDKAGNETETSVQEFYVDTIAPAVDLPAEWEVNETITYKIQDDGSGLSALRIVIEDEDEKFAKVAWDEVVSGNKFKGEITWNGKFKDGTIAPPGEYLVWVKTNDVASNEHIALGRVIVPQPFASFSLIQPSKSSTEIPTPPADLFDPEDLSPIPANPNPNPSTLPNTSFGGSTPQTSSTGVQSLTLTSGKSSASTTTSSNVLWGTTAAALIGWATATALEEKKKRKEQEQAQAAQVKAQVDAFNEAQSAKRIAEMKQWKINSWLEGQAILNAQIEQLEQQGATPKEINALKEKAKTDGLGVAHNEAGILGVELKEQKMKQAAQADMTEQEKWQAYTSTPEYIARQERLAEWQQEEEKKKAQDLQDGLAAYYAATRQGEQEVKDGGPKVNAALALDDPPWWIKLIDAGKKAVDDAKEWVNNHVVQPAKETVNKAITTAKNFVTTTVTTAKETFQTVKNDVKQRWEDTKQWVNTSVIQPAKDTINKVVTKITTAWDQVKLFFSPVASLPWNPALRSPASFAQNQKNVTSGTGGVECVTTTAVVVRNIMNEYLAHLSNQSRLPDLTVDDYIKQKDSLGTAEWFYRVPSTQPPVLGIPVAGWMHPRLQMRNALNEFASDFGMQYGCSYSVEQSSSNSYNDIARNVREGNLVIIHGMYDPDPTQAWIGGAPHTMGPVIKMDGKEITLVQTNGKTVTMSKEEFMEFWSRSSQIQVPGPDWLPQWLRPKLSPFFTYTPPNTMTVVIPDTVCSPVNTPTSISIP